MYTHASIYLTLAIQCTRDLLHNPKLNVTTMVAINWISFLVPIRTVFVNPVTYIIIIIINFCRGHGLHKRLGLQNVLPRVQNTYTYK